MSITEILVILALVLVLFGPDELPKMAKTLGKGLRELRKAGDDLRGTLEQEMVKLDAEPTPRRDPEPARPEALPPVASSSADPAAARAAARFAAAGLEPPASPTAASSTPAPTPEPEVKLIPAEGTVPREGVEPRPLPTPPAEGPAPVPPHGDAP